MKYGSFINSLEARGVIGEPEPEIGMGASLLYWSDRHAASIVVVEKKDDKVVRIGVKRDSAKRIDKNGMSESQEYAFSPNPDSMVEWFAKDRKGMWRKVHLGEASGRWLRSSGGPGLKIGERSEYHDFSF